MMLESSTFTKDRNNDTSLADRLIELFFFFLHSQCMYLHAFHAFRCVFIVCSHFFLVVIWIWYFTELLGHERFVPQCGAVFPDTLPLCVNYMCGFFLFFFYLVLDFESNENMF